jgi:ATPase subunit of ABC transporter with duplicated ATPase domains
MCPSLRQYPPPPHWNSGGFEDWNEVVIATSKLTKRFGQDILFEDVSVQFTPGNCYGLIGANGSGKSTFVKILAGLIPASQGDVIIGRDCTLGYLRQDHAEFDGISILDTVYMGNKKLWDLHLEREALYSKTDLSDEEHDRCGMVEEEFGEAGGYTMEADAAKLLAGLGFTEDVFTREMSTLKGGFKLRVLLAQVLFAHPDVLLLDEPTNHLDLESIEWLVELLKRYEGTVVVISHDRFFLNQVCTHIADLDYHEIRMFTGNYDDFTIASLEARELREKSNKKLEKQIHDLKTFISRFSANASKAKQATSRQKLLGKIELEEVKPSSRVSPYIRFEPKRRLGDKVIQVNAISKGYDTPLFSDFSCKIIPKEKIAIIGKNGVGKTTLLKILCGLLPPDSGSVVLGDTIEFSIFPQDPGEILDPDSQAMAWLRQYSDDKDITETDLRSFMGRMLFSKDDVFKPIQVLSGGEKARLILAKMMLESGNVIVLDEPTNHLDLESIEALNFALSQSGCTIIFVSHDHRLIGSLATRILEIKDGKVLDRSCEPGSMSQ